MVDVNVEREGEEGAGLKVEDGSAVQRIVALN